MKVNNPMKAIIVIASSVAVFGVMLPMAGGSVDGLLGSPSAVGNCSAFAFGHAVGGQSTVGSRSNVCGSAHSQGHSQGRH
jgi:hypothetical protein